MLNRLFFLKASLFVLLYMMTACSIPPEVPVTRQQLLNTRIYSLFVVNESPEQLLNALNAHGDVVIEGKRRLRGKEYPVHIKLLATPHGIEIVDYDR